MQVTPFSAIISLRKTFITDKTGKSILPLERQGVEEAKKMKAENSVLKSNLQKITLKQEDTKTELEKEASEGQHKR